MGWRHHIHYWWVPFDISSTMLIFSISYFLLGEKFGWVFFLQDLLDVWALWGRTQPCWQHMPSFWPFFSYLRCNCNTIYPLQLLICHFRKNFLQIQMNGGILSFWVLKSSSCHFQMTCGILGFIFKDWIKSQATSGFQAFIVHYRYHHYPYSRYMYVFRDDPDQQNLIDWIQEGWLQCCGIEGPTVSPFFNQMFLIIKIKSHPCSNNSLLQRPNFRTGTRTSTSTAAAKLLAHVRPVASHSGFLFRVKLWLFGPWHICSVAASQKTMSWSRTSSVAMMSGNRTM